jgi:hypothetical protein
MKIPPQAQMWIGATGTVLFLLRLIMTVTHPMATADWIEAYAALCSASILAGVAWRGYQRRKYWNSPAGTPLVGREPSK